MEDKTHAHYVGTQAVSGIKDQKLQSTNNNTDGSLLQKNGTRKSETALKMVKIFVQHPSFDHVRLPRIHFC